MFPPPALTLHTVPHFTSLYPNSYTFTQKRMDLHLFQKDTAKLFNVSLVYHNRENPFPIPAMPSYMNVIVDLLLF
jgi:hypothetical protein